MDKGLFSIPVYNQNVSMDKVIDEIVSQVVEADKWGVNEAFFGEHITDKHEKITSSLLMVSTLSKLTKKIKLGTLTTNLNFHNPAVVAVPSECIVRNFLLRFSCEPCCRGDCNVWKVEERFWVSGFLCDAFRLCLPPQKRDFMRGCLLRLPRRHLSVGSLDRCGGRSAGYDPVP